MAATLGGAGWSDLESLQAEAKRQGTDRGGCVSVCVRLIACVSTCAVKCGVCVCVCVCVYVCV